MENRLFLLLIASMIIARSTKAQDNCPNKENYKPCTCSSSNGAYDVTCNTDVSLTEVANIFNRTTPSSLHSFKFYLSAIEGSNNSSVNIPSNLMGKHRAESISLICSDYEVLMIEPEAFQSSQTFTTSFYMSFCNMGLLKFDYLKGFGNLTQLKFSFMLNVHLATWNSLPPLHNLTDMSIYYSKGLNDWTTFPSLTSGLGILSLESDEIRNAALDHILNWIVGHSANTLETLHLSDNNLTSIPRQIPSFSRLRVLDLGLQRTKIQTITKGALDFSASKIYFYGTYDGIEKIEPGAFRGNFNGLYVFLYNNSITRLEESVFKEMLQQMATNSDCCGKLSMENNPIDCESDPCHLAWIMRDHRNLLSPLVAQCSNGTSFQKLNPDAFSQCDLSTVPPTPTIPSSSSTLFYSGSLYQFLMTWMMIATLLLL